MPIVPFDALSAQRDALASGSAADFIAGVMTPLADFWRPHLHRMPPPPDADPALAVAEVMGFHSPSDDRAAGLAALREFEEAGTWPACVRAIERAYEALAPEAHGVAMEPVRFTLLLGTLRVLRLDWGAVTGFQQPGMALVMGWPNPVGTPRLPVASAHELNHIVRFKVEPWTSHTTVGQYMVAEGLAEAFGVEVVGDPSLVGRYSAALAPSQVEDLRPRFREGLRETGFDRIRGWIFGDWSAEQFRHERLGIPDYAGYTIGYEVVQAYRRRTGRSAAEATYLPWEEIVEESRYFAG